MRLKKHGIILTFDMAVALLLLFTVMLIATAYYSRTAQSSFQSNFLRSSMYDASSTISELGYLYAPLESENASNSSGIRQVLRNLPPSICMEVSAYEIPNEEGLIAYWNFDEGSGTLAHDSIQGHDASIMGAFWDSDSKRGGHSMRFTGTASSATSTQVFWEDSFSVSAWVKPDSGQAPYAIIIGNEAKVGIYPFRFLISSSGTSTQYSFYVNNTGLSYPIQGGAIVPGSWQYLVGTFDGTMGKLYVDGVLVGNHTFNKTTVKAIPISIGGYQMPAGGFWVGKIDEAKMYDRPLTAAEIQRMYASATSKLYTVASDNCKYSGGQLQSMSFPFSHNANTGKPKFYISVIRAWYKGA